MAIVSKQGSRQVNRVASQQRWMALVWNNQACLISYLLGEGSIGRSRKRLTLAMRDDHALTAELPRVIAKSDTWL